MPLPEDNFVPLTHFVRPVELADGKEHPITFRRLSHADWESFRLDNQSFDSDTKAGSTSRLIAVSVVDVVGKTLVPSMTYEKARTLSDDVAKRLVHAILDGNGKLGQAAKRLTKAAKKKSDDGTPEITSGSS